MNTLEIDSKGVENKTIEFHKLEDSDKIIIEINSYDNEIDQQYLNSQSTLSSTLDRNDIIDLIKFLAQYL